MGIVLTAAHNMRVWEWSLHQQAGNPLFGLLAISMVACIFLAGMPAVSIFRGNMPKKS